MSDFRADKQALHDIFGEGNLQSSAGMFRQWADLSELEQYRLLQGHVFPAGTSVIRCDSVLVDAAMLAGERGSRPGSARVPFTPSETRSVVPVSLLIDAATQLGKLDEVEASVAQRLGERDADLAHALIAQALIAIAREESDEAVRLLGELEPLVCDRNRVESLIGSTLELIAKAERLPALHESCLALLFCFYEFGRESGSVLPERWKRRAFAAYYSLHWRQFRMHAVWGPDAQVGEVFTPQRWYATSRSTALSEEGGYPAAQWAFERGHFEKTGGHDRDFLYFDVPVVGDFEVEAIVSGFDYCETRLGYGGHWAGPGHDHLAILNGHFAGDDPTISLPRPLDDIGSSMRVRLVIRNGFCETLINGRSVCRKRVSSADPWVTIFSQWYTHGWVRDLRITGDPTVPAMVNLVEDERLLGWSSYFDESIGKDRDWQVQTPAKLDGDGSGETPVLKGDQHGLIKGSFQESLLQYGRPLGDQETISYEFFYRRGSHSVHPAIGRDVVLLDSDRIAWLPETGELRFNPINQNAASLLRNDQWNRAEIVRFGESIELHLNGESVFHASIDPGQTHQFGLFHFCDQTTALVRKVVLSGDWPMQLPTADQQELAEDTVKQLVQGTERMNVFHHEFSEGLPLDSFFMTGNDWTKHFLQVDEGIHCEHPGGKHVQYGISPNLETEGDFDLTAEFAGFEAAVEEGGDASVHLKVSLPERSTDCVLYRKFTRYAKKEIGEQIVQSAIFTIREGERTFHFPFRTSEAATSGKLRLVRRGDQIHYLFAAHDSTQFRYLYSETVPKKSAGSAKIRLVVETTRNGHAKAIWKSLTVRADRLSGPAVMPSLSVAQLGQSRDALAQSRTLDYSDQDVQRSTQTIGQSSSLQATEKGLLITAPGSDTWTGHGLTLPFALHGDFDVAAEMDVERLDPPAGRGESVVFLETEFRDPKKTSIHAKFAISPSNRKTGEVQLRQVSETGKFDYTELVNYPASNVQLLRVARRQEILYVLIQEAGHKVAKVLGKLEVGNHPILADDLRFILHADGEGRQVRVLLKRVTAHADRIDP
ncbi:DUF1583 domain-containing protein [Rhodopirellula baltica]